MFALSLAFSFDGKKLLIESNAWNQSLKKKSFHLAKNKEIRLQI